MRTFFLAFIAWALLAASAQANEEFTRYLDQWLAESGVERCRSQWAEIAQTMTVGVLEIGDVVHKQIHGSAPDEHAVIITIEGDAGRGIVSLVEATVTPSISGQCDVILRRSIHFKASCPGLLDTMDGARQDGRLGKHIKHYDINGSGAWVTPTGDGCLLNFTRYLHESE